MKHDANNVVRTALELLERMSPTQQLAALSAIRGIDVYMDDDIELEPTKKSGAKVKRELEELAKPEGVFYCGKRYDTLNEAKWAAFFTIANVPFVYRPAGKRVSGNRIVTPEFKIAVAEGRGAGELYVFVCDESTPDSRYADIWEFSMGDENETFATGLGNSDLDLMDDTELEEAITPCYVVKSFPEHSFDAREIQDVSGDPIIPNSSVHAYNFELIDGDMFTAHPGVNKLGQFELFGDDSSYLCDRDDSRTTAIVTRVNGYDYRR